MAKKVKRPRRREWLALRRKIWTRDEGKCVHCLTTVSIRLCHIDHIKPISEGGDNGQGNLRTLCRRCHVLRLNSKHRYMITKAINDGIIPPNWRELAWE